MNAKLIPLTIILLGIQFLWTVEFAQGTLHLVNDLGMSPQWSTLVWLAGPLSGLFVQPWIGFKSDSFNSVYGKRRYFNLRLSSILLPILRSRR